MSYNCVLCTNSVEETVEQLFLHCPFARSCWSLFNLAIIQADPLQILAFSTNSTQCGILYGHYHPHLLEYLNCKEWAYFEGRQPDLISVS
jgi:hypothetical protein